MPKGSKTFKKSKGVTKKKRDDRDHSLKIQKSIAQLHIFDTNIALNSIVASAGTVVGTTLNACIEGIDTYHRIGKRIGMKYLHVKGYIQPTNASTVDDIGRMMIVYDKQPNQASVNLGNVITDSNAGGGSIGLSHRNASTLSRFTVLKDEMWYLPRATAVQAVVSNSNPNPVQSQFVINWFLPLKGRETEYVANAGTYTDITVGALQMYFFTENPSINAIPWQFIGVTRVKFQC